MIPDMLKALEATDKALEPRPVIQARYDGPWVTESGTIELWTLLEDIPGHPVGSTVSANTIRKAGYALPNVKTP